ncbi:hypothetical protein ACHWQZ_G007830 [Mnemiopsis leidyi]
MTEIDKIKKAIPVKEFIFQNETVKKLSCSLLLQEYGEKPSRVTMNRSMELEHKYGMDAKIEHKYFDLVREEYVDGKKRTIRRCKICQRDYKGTASVNSNFITHLKHVHPELLHDWARKKAERAEKATSFLARHQGTSMLPAYGRNYLTSIAAQVPKADFLSNPLKHEGLTPTSLASLNNMGQTDADRQVAIMRSVLNYLVMDIQPASVINRKGFRNLIRAMHPFFGLPTATQIRDTLIPSAYEHVKDSIISQLSLVPVVNLQISVISNCFVAVTAYYLSVYWELKHHLLAVHVISPGMEWENLVEQTKHMYGITNKIYYEKVNRLSLEDFKRNSKLNSGSKPDNEATSSEGEGSDTVQCDSSFAYVITKVIHQALNNPKLSRLLDERCATLTQQGQEGPLFTPFWLQVLAKLRVFINNNKDVVSLKTEADLLTSSTQSTTLSTTLSNGVTSTLNTGVASSLNSTLNTSLPNGIITSLSSGLSSTLANTFPTSLSGSLTASLAVANGLPVSMANGLPVSMANGLPVSVTNGLPVTLANGISTGLTNGLPTSFSSGLPNMSLSSKLSPTSTSSLPTTLSSGLPCTLPNSLSNGLNTSLNGLKNGMHGLNTPLNGLSSNLTKGLLNGSLSSLSPPRNMSPTSSISPARDVKSEPVLNSPFSAHNISILQDLSLAVELIDILEPFEEVYNLISSETSPSVGIVVPSILSLDQLLKEMKPVHLADVVVSLNSALQKHLTPLLRQKYYQEAAALDPRFKMKWCKTSQEESAVQSKLEDLAQELRISNPSPSSNYYKYKADENVNDSKANEQATKRRKLFAFLERNDEKDIKPSSALLLEFNDFVRDQLLLDCECPFRYWQEKCGTYRCLAQLAYYLCSIPACPPPVDKVFLEWIVSVNSFQQCSSLQELERLFFLNVNSSLW